MTTLQRCSTRVARALLLALLAGIAACGRTGEVEPERSPALRNLSLRDCLPTDAAMPDPSRWRFDVELPREAWQRLENPVRWQAPRPFAGGTRMADGDRVELFSGEREYERMVFAARDAQRGLLEPGQFMLNANFVQLRGDDDAFPEGLVLRLHAPRFADRDGRRRAAVGGAVGDGFVLGHGDAERLEFDGSGGGVLHFFLTGADPPAPGAVEQERGEGLELELALDGEIFERVALGADQLAPGAWFSVALPESEGPGGEGPRGEGRGAEGHRELGFVARFASGSRFARAAVLSPVVAAASSEPDQRPDIVLLLLDTFRADNLQAFGGELELAPGLERLAARSVRFTEARSPASWTLPSQGSMLSGLDPFGHGALRKTQALGEDLVMLAEHFRDAGYRTAAVTDSNFVSRVFGFDQGFESFVERTDWSLRATLAAADAVLAHDDPRPLLLFVQTYRTHGPYRTGVEEDNAGMMALQAEALRRSDLWGGDGSLSRDELAAMSFELYREGVRGLDLALGPWLARLDAAGFFERHHLAVTSDHGEAFYEHGVEGHGRLHHEEQVRVPLMLAGPGLAAAERRDPAGPMDLPRTLAGLAGVAPAEPWAGRDLFAEPRVAPPAVAMSFDLIGESEHAALVRGPHKLLLVAEPGELATSQASEAYDLARDPREGENLVGSGADWIEALLASERGALGERLIERVPPVGIELGAELREQLEAIGYTDG